MRDGRKMSWKCWLGICEKPQKMLGKRIEVERKRNAPPIKLVEIIGVCPLCETFETRYHHIKGDGWWTGARPKLSA